MLTGGDDTSQYKDKETFLNVIRSQRLSRQQDNSHPGGNSNAGQIIRGAIQSGYSNNRGMESEGFGTTQSVPGRDAGGENGTGSTGGFASQLRRIRGELAGSDSRTYQSERPTTGSRRFSIKDTYKKYKEALKPEPKPKTGPGAAKKVEGKKLTDAEAIRLRPKLIEFVLWQSEHTDQFIIATTVGHDPTIEIWADISRDEAEIIVDYLLARGKTNVQTASAIRYAAVFVDRLKLGLIILPRMYRTMMIYFERGFSIR